MGKPTGFLEYPRRDRTYAPAADRVTHYDEFVIALSEEDLNQQGGRCMDCGIPFCHNGCPVNNIIPEWNDLVYKNQWRKALETLLSRMRRLRVSVQRPAAMLSPAKLTMASAPSTKEPQPSAVRPSQRWRRTLPVKELSRPALRLKIITSCPSSARFLVRA